MVAFPYLQDMTNGFLGGLKSGAPVGNLGFPSHLPRSVPLGSVGAELGASLSPLGRQTAAFLTTSPELLGLEEGQCVIRPCGH